LPTSFVALRHFLRFNGGIYPRRRKRIIRYFAPQSYIYLSISYIAHSGYIYLAASCFSTVWDGVQGTLKTGVKIKIFLINNVKPQKILRLYVIMENDL
ncbi:MAG: hypothetical protein PUH93_01620, partial [Clostridia bacterium]|nr:hypothetical protein [Clostridia bacterium]